MLVDINLLPEKEEKDRSLLVLFIVLGLVLGVGLISMFYLHHQYGKNINSVQQEITVTKHLVEQAQRQLADFDQSEAVAELENAIKWAENNRAKTVPLLKEITALLPERGFVREFSYQVPGVVNLLVQFDSNREGAYFLDYLNGAEWVQEAELQKMEARDPEDKDVEAGNDFVPRYDVNYKIHIDRTKIAELSADKQGGDDS